MKVKSRSHLEKNYLAGFANLVISKIWIYGNLYVFEGGEYIFDIITELPCLDDLENPDQLPVQEGTWRYWWLCLMNFWNFLTIYVFEGEESISDIPT